jgi:hypothetical protein
MFLIKWLLIFSTLTIFNKVMAQSFSKGNEFQSIAISGNVSVDCHGPNGEFSAQVFRCHDVRLDPIETDFFVGPNVDADVVQLRKTQTNGKVLTVKNSYQGGQSVKKFNLWLSSLFQTPLLNEGENKISYNLLKGSRSVTGGDFVVNVKQGIEKVCPHGYISSGNLADCSSSFSACQAYFQRYNYCF